MAATQLDSWYRVSSDSLLTSDASFTLEADVYDYIADERGVMMLFSCIDTMRIMLNSSWVYWGIRRMDTDDAHWFTFCPPGYRYRQEEVKPQYVLLRGTVFVTAEVPWDYRKLQKGFCYKPESEQKVPLRATLTMSV